MRISRSCKKRWFAFVFISLFVLLTVYNTQLLLGTDNSKNSEIKDPRKKLPENVDASEFEPYVWVFNYPLAQYSSKLILNPPINHLLLEAFALCDFNDEKSINDVKFVVRTGSNASATYFSPTLKNALFTNIRSNRSARALWQFKLELEFEAYKNEYTTISFALVKYSTIEELFNRFESHQDVKYLISYQKPKIFDLSLNNVKKGIYLFSLDFIISKRLILESWSRTSCD